ncbi:MAG: maleylpyruvate isomerase family mycothiol-dependent enzyme [Actinobacteria bacterium]|nr:maleylpyruvate isomerase family mycothiol-dependent enzyme [Actinomycetota bacterium]
MSLVVPTCPEWNVEKLVRHLGAHHRWVSASIEAQDPSTETLDIPEPDLVGEELLEWLIAGVEDLAGLLELVPEDRPAWSWAGDHRKGFWSRRTTVETTIHRWDVENAVGVPVPLDPALAADGVDEMATVIIPGEPYSEAPGTVLLETTDTGDAWAIKPGPETTFVSRAAPGDDSDLRVVGPADALLLGLWGRGTERLEIEESTEAGSALLAWLIT